MPTTYPPGYVPFEAAREALPPPTGVRVSEAVELETLHVPGPDPALVFVHGGLGSLWNPYPQLATFAGDRELVTYSLAGNGGSTERPDQSIDGHVADLRGLLDELGVERPILHGHSYGTAVAVEYAKRHPAAGVVLHAGGDHDLTPSWEKPLLRPFLALRLYRLAPDDALVRRLVYRVGFHGATPRAVVEDFLLSNPLPDRRSAWTTVTEAFWGYDGRADADRLTAPALVVHGPADGIVPVDVARDTAARLPSGVFCRLERTGHVAFAERPAAYNDLLRAMFDAAVGGHDLEAAVRARTRRE
ncbi:alpha/beta fold hydrolase [Halostella litorea]|uniref:alpha/beta fold hydrolase n=1 Tax=Halostella litorea TaxID=2528831 RepID=UPI0010933340|nr:alpha/beta hydrolase [Halostella litorea]